MNMFLCPLEGGFKKNDTVIDITAEKNGWSDVEGKVDEVDGSNVKVKYTTGSTRWKLHINLRLKDVEAENERQKSVMEKYRRSQ